MTIELVSLDAMGTLVALEPPAPRLRAALAERFPDREPPSEGEAAAAMRAEIGFYRAHMLAWPLDRLRAESARVLREALPRRFQGEDLLPALLDALRFTPYPEVPGVLRDLRKRELRVVVTSNWDASLPDVLARCGLLEHVDEVFASAVAGAAKPDPRIFLAALGGTPPHRALHAGDDPVADVRGARAVGMRALLVDRPAIGLQAVLRTLD